MKALGEMRGTAVETEGWRDERRSVSESSYECY